jgi:hypothetical protein
MQSTCINLCALRLFPVFWINWVSTIYREAKLKDFFFDSEVDFKKRKKKKKKITTQMMSKPVLYTARKTSLIKFTSRCLSVTHSWTRWPKKLLKTSAHFLEQESNDKTDRCRPIWYLKKIFVHLPLRKRLVYCRTTTAGYATGFQTQQLSYDFRASWPKKWWPILVKKLYLLQLLSNFYKTLSALAQMV